MKREDAVRARVRTKSIVREKLSKWESDEKEREKAKETNQQETENIIIIEYEQYTTET